MLDRFATHLPVLERAIALTTGPIIECGTGKFSTPLIHEKAGTRSVLSIDGDAEWLAKSKAAMESATHRFALVTPLGGADWNLVPYQSFQWSVALVDQHPSAARLVSIAALADHCEFIVVHDTETPTYYYERLFGTFKYRYDHKALDPWTTVVSNFRQFEM